MRLVTFAYDNEIRAGVEVSTGIVDLAIAAPALPRTLVGLLTAGDRVLRTAAAAASRAQEDGIGLLPPAAVVLQAPLPRPGKILGVALNYRDHAEEAERPIPEVPFVFSKATTAVIGPGAPIVLPGVSEAIDYEGELAVVVGRTARRVAAARALHHVAGYTIMVDVTARDYQAQSGHCLAKSFDTFAPMGPAVVTLDELPDPGALELRTTLSGTVVQSSNTRNMIFGVSRLIEYVSAVLTLEPGDVITTGTPGGVGARREPPRFLRRGDVVRVEIEGVGVLENPVAGPE